MSVPVEDKKIYKGQDKDYPIYVTESTGLKTLTACQLVLSIRETVDGTPVIEKDSDNAGEIDIAANQVDNKGEAIAFLVPADTSALDPGRYYYDLWIIDAVSKTWPILTGYFWIYEVAPNIVSDIRTLLDEGGEMQILTINNDVVDPRAITELFLPRTRINSVEGVWLGTDKDHTGTNYYSGGGFDSNIGKVWLGTALPNADSVFVSYTWEQGIDDEAIYHHLHASRLFIIEWTGVDFEFGKVTTQRTKAAEKASIARAILGCILTINGANVAQMGYNFRLSELEIQTKLWGEGMIAEALFNVYIQRYQEWLRALGAKVSFWITKKSRAAGKYDIDTYLADPVLSDSSELSE